MSLNQELADLFSRFAALLELKGENKFKAIAFSNVGRTLKDLPGDVKTLVETNQLKGIKGIGESSRKIIEDYVRTGRSADYDDLAASIPAGLVAMLGIEGMGPKTAALVWKQAGVTSIDDLVAAIDAGRLAGIKGLGEKKIASIRAGIDFLKKASGRIGIAEALPIAQAMLRRLRELKQVRQAEYAGSLRRGRETIGDIDLLCTLKNDANGAEVCAAFSKFPEVDRVITTGEVKASIVTARGVQVDLRVVPADSFGSALLYFTGSKEHNVRLRGRALDRKMTLNEWGLWELKESKKSERDESEDKNEPRDKGKRLAGKTEAEIYERLGLVYIEPELREDRGEIDSAEKNTLPRLIEIGDIRGDLHTHTVASDGINTIEEMAEAAKARGYEFLAITDHSKSQAVARGLTSERLLEHIAAIRKASDRIKGITLLAGSEVDILADGHLDYDDEILKELDFVVASPHVALKQDQAKATDRLLKAIEHRYVNVIGHPTGRLINAREGLPLDFEKIYEAAKRAGVALEINAGYPRLDLNEVQARGAHEAGVMLSINTDAHGVADFDWLHWGIGVARRAWTEKKSVINCLPLGKLQKFIQAKR